MDTHQRLVLQSVKTPLKPLERVIKGYKHPYGRMDKYIKCKRCEEGFYGEIYTSGQYECPFCKMVVEIIK
jgi:hypothetical protein